MRSIFHEILARYLETDQHAFEATSRELWPQPTYESPPARQEETRLDERNGHAFYDCAPTPQN